MKKLTFLLVVACFLSLLGCNEEIPNEEEKKPETEVTNPKTDEEIVSEMVKWVEENYDGKEIEEDISLPLTHETLGGSYEWLSTDEDLLTSSGEYTKPLISEALEVYCYVKCGDIEESITIIFNLVGEKSNIDAAEEEIKNLFPSIINSTVRFPSTLYGCTITWESNSEALKITGVYNRPDDNEEVTLSYTIASGAETKEGEIKVMVEGKSDAAKAYEVELYLNSLYENITSVTEDITLVTTYEKFNPKITWSSSAEGVISSSGKFTKPLIDQEVVLTATIKVGNDSLATSFTFKTLKATFSSTWEAIEIFLDNIYQENIRTQKYTRFGFEEGYEQVTAYNYGYLPFYNTIDNKVTVDIVQKNPDGQINYSRSFKERTQTKWITVHDTATGNPGGTAKSMNNYMHNGIDAEASYKGWHYSVDDKDIYQHLPITETAWHAGDGSRSEPWMSNGKLMLGGGNTQSVGIETCVYYGIDYNVVMRKTAGLVATLLKEFDLDVNAVKQHYDFSGKDCPMTMRHAGRWEEFLNLVRLEFFALNYLEGVSFEWLSLSPTIMDNTGKIINHPLTETKVSYKVRVTYDGVTKDYDYTATLLNISW